MARYGGLLGLFDCEFSSNETMVMIMLLLLAAAVVATNRLWQSFTFAMMGQSRGFVHGCDVTSETHNQFFKKNLHHFDIVIATPLTSKLIVVICY